ncbi:hypothetical protein HU675_0038640 [Bradyrhizobium septentrionale]|uniref:hypothetical protein n=1 Tax=Bradyrhizobium septentrionale TaxID=1404411 RepID=UPI001596A8E4|nr:hypothetical protein [Bradyrhizobium septentrionale]UGY23805.1 hypothetical protein HU675_0038640 [Bradyrhizobium septentrionale]
MTNTETVQEHLVSAGDTVWVLVIDNRSGTHVDAFKTKEAADAALFDYCDEWWDQEFGAHSRPADDQLVKTYWERESARGEEWHVLQESRVKQLAVPA